MIPIYKRKPEFVEAIQFLDDVDTISAISDFTLADMSIDYGVDKIGLIIFQDEKNILLKPTDFLCKRSNGNLFKLNNQTFQALYEKANG